MTDSPVTRLTSPTRREALAAATGQQQTPVKQQQTVQNADSDAAGTSSPKGAKDIFSMNTDKQLSDLYKFVKEVRSKIPHFLAASLTDLRFRKLQIGYGNWVGLMYKHADQQMQLLTRSCVMQGSVWEVQQKQAAKETMAVKLVFRVKDDRTTPARVRSIWQEFKYVFWLVCSSVPCLKTLPAAP